VTYQDSAVIAFLTQNFVPWRIDYLKQTDLVSRFRVEWTPWVAIIDERGTEHHHDVGLLVPDQFLGQIKLGLARMAYHQGDFAKASELFDIACKEHPQSAAAPEAIWFRGVSSFRAFGNASVLGVTRRELEERYPHSVWGQKAGAWGA
jgi:hypothetical protein